MKTQQPVMYSTLQVYAIYFQDNASVKYINRHNGNVYLATLANLVRQRDQLKQFSVNEQRQLQALASLEV